MAQGSSTATYCLTLKDTGDLYTGIGDMDIHMSVTPERIMQCQKQIQEAPLVVLDGNFSQETIGKFWLENVIDFMLESTFYHAHENVFVSTCFQEIIIKSIHKCGYNYNINY